MANTYLGIDGGIGRLRNPDYSAKAIGTKVYTKTFGRMAIDGGIISNERDYSSKTPFNLDISGGVQADSSTVAGNITRTAFRTISGAVQSQSPTLAGSINAYASLSGAVSSQSATVSGATANYPLSGWSLTDFTADYSGLDPDSPFAGDPTYSAILTDDKCHYETLTDPDSHTMVMNGLGEFTISPSTLTQAQTFDIQIYDKSDGSFGASATITVYPGVADQSLSGDVSSQSATVSGSITDFTVNTLSGGVQAQAPVMLGVVNTGDTHLIVGNVTAQSASVSGSLETVNIISGAVSAESATVSGNLLRITSFGGGVQSQDATLTGTITRQRAHSLAPGIRTVSTDPENRNISTDRERRVF